MTQANPCNEVDALTARQWLDAGQAVLVDVREPAEHASAHIADATLLPLGQLQADRLPDHAGKKLVIHCHAGGRSAKACRQLQEQAGIEAYSMAGGIEAWKRAGLPVSQLSNRPRLDVQRQLQLTIGVGVLTGVLLGAFVWPWFLLLAGLFGAGLTMAGITGLCPLAILIARLPWNARTAACATSPQQGASCCLPPKT